ncbi:MAG TPA: hypothetical protein VIU11_19960 [Nakamurella sp.]
MRIYLPSTVSGLRAAVSVGHVPVRSGVAFAVTGSLRSEYPGWTEEELEYLAMLDASRASLRLLGAAGPDEPSLRVVVAADVDESQAIPRPEADRAAVAVTGGPVAWRQVASVHVDGADAATAVAAAAAMIDAADLGDGDAEFTLGSAEDFDLAWYAPGEIRYLLEELADN